MASTLFYFEAEESCGHGQENHFLEACSMCQRPLNLGRDIFMYKGNSAFCSLQCRQEQIEIDNRPWQPKKSSTGWDLSASWQAIRTAAAAVSWIPSSATTAVGASTAAVTVDLEYYWF